VDAANLVLAAIDYAFTPAVRAVIIRRIIFAVGWIRRFPMIVSHERSAVGSVEGLMPFRPRFAGSSVRRRTGRREQRRPSWLLPKPSLLRPLSPPSTRREPAC